MGSRQGECGTEVLSSGISAKDDAAKYAFLNDQIFSLDYEGATQDDRNYSQAWYTNYKQREALFKPWNPAIGPATHPWESLRVQAIQNFWRSAKIHRISPVTVHLAIWIFNRLLYHFVHQLKGQLTRDTFAGSAAVALRTALKFEERPEALWGIRGIWHVLPLFMSWEIDRSDRLLMKIESDALKVLDDCMDCPLSVQFFDKFVQVGGWPKELTQRYTSLGHFLLALATFASGDGHPLANIPPSKLAAAALVLSVKIVNGDSHNTYEFFPERFAAFCGMTLKELQPAIRGLSTMLRKKPVETACLGRLYPGWGEHDWQ